MVRFGILGTARIARAFFRDRLDGLQITAVASRSIDKARAFAAEYDIRKIYGGYDELLADPDIDAVYIPLPQHLHAEYVVKSAKAGKHILLEKPAALTGTEIRSMAVACRKHGVIFMEGYMYRFLRYHNRAKEIVAQGTIGELRYIDYNVSVNAWERGFSGFRLDRKLGGGALYDLGIYGIDFLRFATDKEPKLLKSFMKRRKDDGIDVFTHAVYRIGNVIATLTSGYNTDANYYTLSGERGSIHSPVALSGRPDPQLLSIHLHDNNRRYEERFPAENPFKWEIEYVARCIKKNEQPFLGLENSLRNMKLLDELFKRSEAI